MRIFAQKQNQPQKQVSSSFARSDTAILRTNHHASHLMHLQRTIGNQALQRVLQTKFTFNQPGDIYEQEANGVAEQVMNMSAAQVRRTSDCGGEDPKCHTEQPSRKHERLQTEHIGSSDLGQTLVTPLVDEVIRSPGQPLDPAIRTFMEPRFGYDFSGVRVHTDSKAGRSAQSISANAYTAGHHIVFGVGQFAPETNGGRRLLAHELTHVLQQQRVVPNHAKCSAVQRQGEFDRVEDIYGAGSLDENQWQSTLNTARNAINSGQVDEAKKAYLSLYADVAKLAGASSILSLGGDVINVVTGTKTTVADARPGLNLSLGDRNYWGARASTGVVEESGRFAKLSLAPDAPLQQVAIVLSRDVFVPNKAETVGILRHELMHAEHFQEALFAVVKFWLKHKAKSGTSGKPDEQFVTWLGKQRKLSKAETVLIKEAAGLTLTSGGNTELLGYVEGFMTMFHLTDPPPTSSQHPIFAELLGVLDVGARQLLPWAEADPAVRVEALRRLEDYYCHVLDRSHRQAFDDFVNEQMRVVRRDQLTNPAVSAETKFKYMKEPGAFDDEMLEALTKGTGMGSILRYNEKHEDFILGLQKIVTKCQRSRATSMRLE